MSGVMGRVCGVTGRVSGVTGRVSGVMGRVSGVTGRVSGVTGRVSGVTGRVCGVTGRVSGVMGRVCGVTGRVCGVTGRVRGVTGRMRGVTGRVSGVMGRVSGVTGRVCVGDRCVTAVLTHDSGGSCQSLNQYMHMYVHTCILYVTNLQHVYVYVRTNARMYTCKVLSKNFLIGIRLLYLHTHICTIVKHIVSAKTVLAYVHMYVCA